MTKCFVVALVALAIEASACGKLQNPARPSPNPAPSLRIENVLVRVADYSEFGAPLPAVVPMGTRLWYTLLFNVPKEGISGTLASSFETLRDGVVVSTISFPPSYVGVVAGVNAISADYRPDAAGAYTVRGNLALSGASPLTMDSPDRYVVQ